MKGYAGEVSVGAHDWITVHCHNYLTTVQRSGTGDHTTVIQDVQQLAAQQQKSITHGHR